MLSQLLSTALGRFRIVAFLEGCSFILIGLTMILKYQYAMPKPNYVVGMVHGLLFIVYVVMVLVVGRMYRWSLWKMFLAFLASLVPFGTFYADKKLFRE